MPPAEADDEGGGTEADGGAGDTGGRAGPDRERAAGADPSGPAGGTDDRAERAGGADGTDAESACRADDAPATATPDQTRLGEGPAVGAERQSFDSLPAMRVLGQLHDTSGVAETETGLVLVDQHAADERLNYERLRDRLGAFDGQALAEPATLSVTAAEAAAAQRHGDALARLGVRAERTGDRTVTVRSVPEPLTEAGPELVADLLADLAGGRDPGDTVEAVVDELLADLACYPAVTGNTSLTEGSVLDLLAELDDCANPWACPHGRPVVVELDAGELEARFERDYPGHGG